MLQFKYLTDFVVEFVAVFTIFALQLFFFLLLLLFLEIEPHSYAQGIVLVMQKDKSIAPEQVFVAAATIAHIHLLILFNLVFGASAKTEVAVRVLL